MAEIRCPHCGEVFQVDETEYAQIVRQVRDAEFTRELKAREQMAERERTSAVALARATVERELAQAIAERDQKIAEQQRALLEANAVQERALSEVATKGAPCGERGH